MIMGIPNVGKSTLINQVSGDERIKTRSISQSTSKGMHTTTHREMIMLENGAILIDTPGMRELGVVDSKEGIELTFSGIVELSKSCRFENCSHINEPDCGVKEDVETGTISESRYVNYLMMMEVESGRYR